MAEVNFYDVVEFNAIDFSFAGATTIFDDVNWTIHDVDYPSIHSAEFEDAEGNVTSLDVYGTGFEVSGTALVAGTIQAIYGWFLDSTDNKWYYNYEVRGLSISAVEFQAASSTATLADDLALLTKAFAKADTMNLSNDNDYMKGFGGDDTMRGNGGDDTLLGGFGKDVLLGGNGADELWGGQGMDRLNGGRGNDELWGGQAADVFVFTGAFGTDTVHDFQDGIDHLDFGGAKVVVTQHDADTWITLGGKQKVILVGIDADLISNADFILNF